MLIRFGAENYRSIRERQELSLVAAALRDGQADLLKLPTFRHELLPAAVIYGANASGKSTILASLKFLRDAVVNSHKEVEREPSVPRTPFLLDGAYANQDSTFFVDFVHNSIRYSYGFSCVDNHFTREWLYAYPRGTQQVWFERSDKDGFYFGKSLKGQLRAIEQLTRPDSLFLSVGTQYNNEQISEVSSYIRRIDFIDNSTLRRPNVDSLRLYQKELVEFLTLADTGVVHLDINELDPDAEDIDIEKRVRAAILSAVPHDRVKFEALTPFELTLLHRGNGGMALELPFAFESQGTIRSISLLPRIFNALSNGSPILVDELDGSLHTVLSETILHLFNDSRRNSNNSQLIATTHDTNLLVGDVLRRDQIWFTEKGPQGDTVLYPLTDIKTRNTDNLERGYLEGRFGAIPMRTSIRRFREKMQDETKG